MHVADSVLSPTVCAAATSVSIAAVGYSIYRLRDQFGARTIPLTGMVSALIFAAQMVNFPLIGVPISGHLIGGVLAAAILGPWAGLLSITLVLTVQCLMFGDGGLIALGANILNMGVVGAWGGSAMFQWASCRFQNRNTGIVVGAVAAAWLSVVAASTLFSLEFWCSYQGTTSFDFSGIFTQMLLVHAAIGCGEALITFGILAVVLAVRPDLVRLQSANVNETSLPIRRFLVGGIATALVVAACLSPFASGNPDGLEAVAARESFDALATPTSLSLLEDYEVHAFSPAWEELGLWKTVSVSLAGISGTLVILSVSWILVQLTRRRFDRIEAAA